MIASSKRRYPRDCRPRIANAITPVISAAGNSGTPNSRFKPSAAPTNSATSVAIAITSACTHIPHDSERGYCARNSAGRLCSVTIPSFADRYCTSIAIRFATSTTHSSR